MPISPVLRPLIIQLLQRQKRMDRARQDGRFEDIEEMFAFDPDLERALLPDLLGLTLDVLGEPKRRLPRKAWEDRFSEIADDSPAAMETYLDWAQAQFEEPEGHAPS